jgi:hypothetical protein
MSSFRPPWALCGGWAVDSWLGRQTRDHADIDISVFHDDQRALFDHLAGWHLIAHDPNVVGDTTELWDGRRLDLPAHIHARPGDGLNLNALNTWVRSPGAQPRDGLNLEIMLNERSGRDWVLSREHGITMATSRCVLRSGWGLPTLAPEVIMFYKATAYAGEEWFTPRSHDDLDFRALLPLLTGQGRDWLREAIAIVPAHPWLDRPSLEPPPE